MGCRGWFAVVGLLVVLGRAVAEEPKPQWQRTLSKEDAAQVELWEKRIVELEDGTDYAAAAMVAISIRDLRAKVQGPDHWETVSTEWNLKRLEALASKPEGQRLAYRQGRRDATKANDLYVQGKYQEAQPLLEKAWEETSRCLGHKHPDTALRLFLLAFTLNTLGKYTDAQHLHERALDIRIGVLGDYHPDTAQSLEGLASNLRSQGKYADAQPLFERALAIRTKVLGNRHPDTAHSMNSLALNLESQGKYADAQPLFEQALAIRTKVLGDKHVTIPFSLNNLAMNLAHQGRYADARTLFQRALTVSKQVFGDEHPLTTGVLKNLAANLSSQGQHADAQPLYERALAVDRKVWGEKQPAYARSLNLLAMNLGHQGRYSDAQPLFERALAIRTEALGERHPETVESLDGLTMILKAQGQYADAQPLFERALAIRKDVLGDKHPDTVTSLNNLAVNLNAQGRYADAQPLYERALAIRKDVLGDKHPDTVTSLNNLAVNLNAQGRYADAQPLFERALAIRKDVLGDKHPDTATSLNNLALNLNAQGRYADAQPLYERALAVTTEALGDKHPDTATSLNNLAVNLNAQGRYADAQPLYERALAVTTEALGDKHPSTALSLNNLAVNLYAQGRYADATAILRDAAVAYETARVAVATDGLDRAAFGADRSPYPRLAAVQARLGRPEAAWASLEADLARGLLDQMATPDDELTEAEQARDWALRSRLTAIQTRLVALATRRSADRTPEESAELARLRTDRSRDDAELAALAMTASRRRVASLADIRAALPADTALVAWVDRGSEHWACVVRFAGDPAWVRLPGTGDAGAWTPADAALPGQLTAALVGSRPTADLATRLAAQRLASLAPHLTDVHHLLVVPTGLMAGVPVEALTDAYTVSYVPSGTFLARRKDRPAPPGDRVLALGDPIFTRPGDTPKGPAEPPLPPGGLLVQQVVPGGNAAAAKPVPIADGAVLLTYAGADLTTVEQLREVIAANAGKENIPVTVWIADGGQGKTVTRFVRPGPLGVALATDPAPVALAARHKLDLAVAAATRGPDLKPLPGTRVEADRMIELFGDRVTTLVGSDASEQRLEQLRSSGELAKFRYLHFGTHGLANNDKAFASALFLARDKLPGGLPVGGRKYYDGELTAQEVLRDWKLDADLVTLSACETALGRNAGGDGLLGFAQAFLTAGSRAVCLSLWSVDDTATALLMDRFYANLAGKRPGLAKPMGKAAALAEAKAWLRNLTVAEAAERAAKLTKDAVARGAGAVALEVVTPEPKPGEPAPAAGGGPKPFAHPKYWAAFILIGDPD